MIQLLFNAFLISSDLFFIRIAGTILKKMSKKAIMSSRIEKLWYVQYLKKKKRNSIGQMLICLDSKDLSDHSVPIALPVRARLILGLARIHDKQVHYLYMEAIKVRPIYFL